MVTAKKMFTAKMMDRLVFEKKMFSRLYNKYYVETMADRGECTYPYPLPTAPHPRRIPKLFHADVFVCFEKRLHWKLAVGQYPSNGRPTTAGCCTFVSNNTLIHILLCSKITQPCLQHSCSIIQ